MLMYNSSVNPSFYVDYNSNKDSSGYFKYVLDKYRKVAGLIRQRINGPIQGEGNNHFLYAGYYDDFEARIYTADERIHGVNAPLLLNFDMLKIRPKSALHGVGHYDNFFNKEDKCMLDEGELLQYIATEIAYGQSPLITKAGVDDHMLDQAKLEYQHTYQIQKYIYNQTPITILYYNKGTYYNASDYIKTYDKWYDYTYNDFMSRVKIIYPNNVIVYVNRNNNLTWDLSADLPNRGVVYFYNLGEGNQGISKQIPSLVKLPSKYGWLVCVPSGMLQKLNSYNKLQLEEEFKLENNYPNPFNPTTTISYYVPYKTMVTIKIYDLLGQEVTTLVNEIKEKGNYKVEFNSSNLANGVYFYSLKADNFIAVKKILLIK